MKTKLFPLVFTTIILFQSLLHGDTGRNFFLQKTKPQHIFVNNRILAQINGKPISVIDVMKKMDMVFYRRFPQYSSSTEARFQFYQINWKHILNELVEKELIMADAEEVKMEVSHGDIRQEMENMFGPNIIGNLTKAGLTHDEAWQIIKEDLTLKRMMMARVNSKAVRSVTPRDIRAAYEVFANENARPDAWCYQVISIQGDDPTICAEVANYAYQLVVEENVPLDDLQQKLEESSLVGSLVALNISEEHTRTGKELSEAYMEILSKLRPRAFSPPVAQKSRTKQGHLFRIFYLKEKIAGGAPPFSEVEHKLKTMLIEKKVDEEATRYIARLRQHFDVQGGEGGSLYSQDFKPFTLQ